MPSPFAIHSPRRKERIAESSRWGNRSSVWATK